MAPTNFPSGITSFGIPVAGSLMPVQGKYIFCKPRTGLDGNDGLSAETAVKTLTQALAIATADQNDTVVYFAEGNTSSDTTDYLTATLTWNKNLVHLVGIDAGGMVSGRCRIATQTTGITPLVNITANGCQWSNINVFHGVTSDQTGLVAVQVTGDRNHFVKCMFSGGGISTTADDTGMRSLKLSGASEGLFEDCVIGLDTISRTVANFELEFANGSSGDGCARTIFRNCNIITYSTTATRSFLTCSADAIDRWVKFEYCTFINAINSGATTMTEALSVATGTSPNGLIFLKDCSVIGATDWEANTESARVYIDGGAPTNNTSGLAVIVEAT